MSKVLVLGATGGIGGEVARQLSAAGWQVCALTRDVDKARSQNATYTWLKGDALNRDEVIAAARGCAVIVHAVNPPGYRNWAEQVLPMIDNTIAAAIAERATIVLPGTVYNFGALIRLSRAEFIDQPIDKLLISSGLLASKSPPASPRESLLAMLIVLSSQLKHGKRSRLVRSRSTASGSRREAFSERSPRRTSLTACSSSCDPGSRRTRLSCWNEHLVGGNLSSPLHVPHPTADASLRMSCVTPRVRSQGHYWGAEPLCAQRLSLLIEGVEPI